MNKIPTILLLLGLLLLQACKRNDYPHTLQQAESVMNAHPDSALHLLQDMADSLTMLPEEAQMYYHLLTIQAKDKQYITHTSDSLINPSYRFTKIMVIRNASCLPIITRVAYIVT